MERISAGDIEKYGYCPLSWWLSLQGDVEDKALESGVVEHKKVEKKLDDASSSLKRSRGMERAVLWSAVLASIVSMAGVTIFPWGTISREGNVEVGSAILAFLALVWLLAATYFLYRSEKIGSADLKNRTEGIITIFSIVAMLLALYSMTFLMKKDELLARVAQLLALMWLVGASLFLYKSLVYYRRYEARKMDAGISRGEMEYHDSAVEKSPLLQSNAIGITGRPDYILQIDGNMIPVEMKTGRIPRGPLFSHILQLSVYCLLVEEEYGVVPPHGILRYGGSEGDVVEHEIEYTPEMKKMVIDKVDEMREKIVSGDVHRNHNKEGKCRNCSRRSICPERLA